MDMFQRIRQDNRIVRINKHEEKNGLTQSHREKLKEKINRLNAETHIVKTINFIQQITKHNVLMSNDE